MAGKRLDIGAGRGGYRDGCASIDAFTVSTVSVNAGDDADSDNNAIASVDEVAAICTDTSRHATRILLLTKKHNMTGVVCRPETKAY